MLKNSWLAVRLLTSQKGLFSMKSVSYNIIYSTRPKDLYKASKFEGFTGIHFKFVVIWFVMPCSDVEGQKRFGGSCCFHLQGEFKMAESWPCETLVSHYVIKRPNNPEDLEL
jgi:hypothetical protein